MYRFQLEKYKSGSKIKCPKCGMAHSFVRYIDNMHIIIFPSYVGRCDREDKCGYHFTPKEYFLNNNIDTCTSNRNTFVKKIETEKLTPSYIDKEYVYKTFKKFERNNLYLFMQDRFGKKESDRLFSLYNVGTSKYWNGATVFWLIDSENRVHSGKVFLYDKNNGHRIKNNGTSKINWVHKILKLPNFNLQQCFFGENLLSQFPSASVGIVESEKTALIATHYIPEFIWLATGGKNGCLNRQTIEVLNGRNVMLIPDLQATDYWNSKIPILNNICKSVKICRILEESATQKQKEEGLDVADFLLEEDNDKNILSKMIQKNKSLGLLIEKLDLQLISAKHTNL